jgi:hypothetical protein
VVQRLVNLQVRETTSRRRTVGHPVRGSNYIIKEIRRGFIIRDPRAYCATGIPVTDAVREWVRYHTRTEKFASFTLETVIQIEHTK